MKAGEVAEQIESCLRAGDKMLPEPIARIARVFCGCGCPDDAWGWVAEYLGKLERKEPIGDDFGGEVMICLYLMAHLELTEHGGSVYGCWLNPDGETALRFLRENGVDWADKGRFVDSQGCSWGDFR